MIDTANIIKTELKVYFDNGTSLEFELYNNDIEISHSDSVTSKYRWSMALQANFRKYEVKDVLK